MALFLVKCRLESWILKAWDSPQWNVNPHTFSSHYFSPLYPNLSLRQNVQWHSVWWMIIKEHTFCASIIKICLFSSTYGWKVCRITSAISYPKNFKFQLKSFQKKAIRSFRADTQYIPTIPINFYLAKW